MCAIFLGIGVLYFMLLFVHEKIIIIFNVRKIICKINNYPFVVMTVRKIKGSYLTRHVKLQESDVLSRKYGEMSDNMNYYPYQ